MEAGEAAAEADAEERRAARCHLKTVQRREMRQEQRWTKEQAMQAALDQLVAMEVDMEDLRVENARLEKALALSQSEAEWNQRAFADAVNDIDVMLGTDSIADMDSAIADFLRRIPQMPSVEKSGYLQALIQLVRFYRCTLQNMWRAKCRQASPAE